MSDCRGSLRATNPNPLDTARKQQSFVNTNYCIVCLCCWTATNAVYITRRVIRSYVL